MLTSEGYFWKKQPDEQTLIMIMHVLKSEMTGCAHLRGVFLDETAPSYLLILRLYWNHKQQANNIITNNKHSNARAICSSLSQTLIHLSSGYTSFCMLALSLGTLKIFPPHTLCKTLHSWHPHLAEIKNLEGGGGGLRSWAQERNMPFSWNRKGYVSHAP